MTMRIRAFIHFCRNHWGATTLTLIVMLGLLGGLIVDQVSTAGDVTAGAVVQSMGNVRIRSEPSLSGDRLGMIGWGEVATLKAIDASGDWYQIEYNGITGWSAAEWFVVAGGNVTAVPQQTNTTAASSTGVTVRALGNMRIRTQPSLNGEQVGLIGWGEQAALLEVSNGWFKINYQGLIGWSSGEWFEVVTGNINNLIVHEATSPVVTTAQALGNVRIREAPDLSAARVGMVPWGGVVIVKAVDPTGEWHLIDYNGIVGWSVRSWYQVITGDVGALIEEATTVTSPTGVVVRALGNVRLRELPGLQSDQIGLIGWGEKLPVLAIDSTGYWIKVDFQGVVGWTASEWYEVISGNLSNFQPTSTTSQVIAMAYGNVRIRNAPSLSARRIGLIPWGSTVVVSGIDASRQWYQVNYNGVVGWTFRDWYRLTSGDVGSVPVIR
jgi:N-acetylmuramoyl-L-alanine amidase